MSIPKSEWDRFEDELKKKPRFDETFFKLENFYFSNAQDCSFDKQGRILLPPMLREYAGLKKDVVFSGAQKNFASGTKEPGKDSMKKLNSS